MVFATEKHQYLPSENLNRNFPGIKGVTKAAGKGIADSKLVWELVAFAVEIARVVEDDWMELLSVKNLSFAS
jgi:hypothetical protein